jgi:hypothetical protein
VVAGTGRLRGERAHMGEGLDEPAFLGPFTTRWPILLSGPRTAKASLAALDVLTGTAYTGGIGTLPRALFDSPWRVRRAMRKVRSTTQQIRAANIPRPMPFRSALRGMFSSPDRG